MTDVWRIVDSNRHGLSLLVGNGINRYYSSGPSWNDLLLDLWNEFSFDTQSDIPGGVSTTEFYDVLEVTCYDGVGSDARIQRKIKEMLDAAAPDPRQGQLLQRIRSLDRPLLTTNIDDLIPKSMGLEFFNGAGKKLTDYYPWECYYSDARVALPTDRFGVWYINGMTRYFRSIKFGLSHYMGNVNRARGWISQHADRIKHTGTGDSGWPGLNSWLHIVFNTDLFVFGLSLEENEVFLRWLLIERARYFRRFPKRKRRGWYLQTDGEKNDGRDFFLRKLGYQILSVRDYKSIYEDLWQRAV